MLSVLPSLRHFPRCLGSHCNNPTSSFNTRLFQVPHAPIPLGTDQRTVSFTVASCRLQARVDYPFSPPTPWKTHNTSHIHALAEGIGFSLAVGVHSKGSGGSASSSSGSVEGASTIATSSGSPGILSKSMMMPKGFPDFRTGTYLGYDVGIHE